jgi:lipopolysaccharide exporter
MSVFAKNIARMSLAPIATQTLGFLIMPIITRLYTPGDYGLFAVFTSIVGPISIFATMGYSTAIVLPNKEHEASALLTISLFLTITITFITSILVFIISSFSISNTEIREFKGYLWLVPVSIFAHGLYLSFRYWNIRHNRYGNISLAAIFKFLVNNAILLIMGFAGFASGIIIVIGGIAGSYISPVILSKHLWRDNKYLLSDSLKKKNIKKLLIRYSKFATISSPTDLLSQLTVQTPIYLLSIFFSQTIIGFYAIGLRLLTMPMSLLGNSIGEVYFQRISQKNPDSRLVTEKVFKYLVVFGFPIFYYLAIFGEEIFSVFFGSKWSEAGVYSQLISLLIFVKFITIPSNYITLVFNKQEYTLYLNIASVIVSSLSIMVGGFYNNVHLSMALFAFSNSILYVVYGFWIMKYIGLSIKTIVHILVRTVYNYIPLIIIFPIIKLTETSTLLSFIISGIILIIYIIIVILSSPETRLIIRTITNYLKIKILIKKSNN